MTHTDWKIIIVEDTFDDQQVVSHILRHYDIEVFVARNGDECLQLLETVEATLVITDLAMPQRNGWQTLVAIRSDMRTAHLPVVAITAYHSAEIAKQVMQVGFDGYFPKPLNPQTFVQQLEEILAS